MAIDDKVKTLENELKLIKSELKQTLVGVRDFLMELKLPPPQEELTVIAPEAGVVGESEVADSQRTADNNGSGGASGMSDFGNEEPQAQDFNAGLPESGELPSFEQPLEEAAGMAPEMEGESEEMVSGEMPGEYGEVSGEMPVEDEEAPTETDQIGEDDMKTDEIKITGSTGSTESQVNLLANLIRWAAAAKREIGVEHLPEFLDVYTLSGNLSEEMKQTILHLVEVATDPLSEMKVMDKSHLVRDQMALCMEINNLDGQIPAETKENIRNLAELIIQQSSASNKANVWSQLILELHGILAGGGKQLRPLNANNRNEAKPDTKAEVTEPTQDENEEPEDEREPSSPPKMNEAKPALLKLVLPGNDGISQELDLGKFFLNVDEYQNGSNGKKSKPTHKR